MFKLFNFEADDGPRVGVVCGDRLYDLRVLADGVPRSVNGLLQQWDEWLARLDAATAVPPTRAALDPATIRLLPPVAPGNIFCAGGNYATHQREMSGDAGVNLNPKPFFFLKASQCVVGPGEAIRLPDPSQAKNIDWEGELAVVVGRQGRNISAAEADEYVAGYTIFNDVSARDRGKRTDVPFGIDWLSAKCFETFGPMGPYLVPRQYVPDPNSLSLRTWVDDVLHQDANTSDLIIKIPQMIEWLSAILTLQPGDLIATGTPSGVGAGKGIFLRSGQHVIVEIEGIGRLENPVE